MCKSNVVLKRDVVWNSGRFVLKRTKKEYAITKGTKTHKHSTNMPLHAAIEALCNAHPASRLDLGGLLNADRAKPGNANVEVLCMAMQDMPLTPEALKAAKGDAEWLRMQWLLLAVGPPGFSTAPYKSSAKEQGPGTATYTVDDSGATVFKAWQKVSNNKDRGAVSEESKHWSRVPPGTFMTGFVRDENLDAKVLRLRSNAPENTYVFDDTDTSTLPRHSFVILEMKSSHVDNADKGQLLKISKIMPIKHSAVPWNMLNSIPTDFEKARGLQDWLRGDDAVAVNKSLTTWSDNGTNKGPSIVHMMVLSKDCFWSIEDDKFVLVNEATGCCVRVDKKTVMRTVPCEDLQAAQKLLDVMSACGAVRVLVQTWAKQVPYDDKESVGLAVFVDLREMMKLDLLAALDSGGNSEDVMDDFAVPYKDDEVGVLAHKSEDSTQCVLLNKACALKGGDSGNDRLIVFRAMCVPAAEAGTAGSNSGPSAVLPLYLDAEDVAGKDHWQVEVFALKASLQGNSMKKLMSVSEENDRLVLEYEEEKDVFSDRGFSRLTTIYLPEAQFAANGARKRKRVSYA